MSSWLANHRSFFDPLNPRDLLADEIAARTAAGRELQLNADGQEALQSASPTGLLQLVDELDQDPWWDGVDDNPQALEEIASHWDSASGQAALPKDYSDRVMAAWQGRIAGCTVGKPLEDAYRWTPETIRTYLEGKNAYPLTSYVPAPERPGDRLVECWPESTVGNIDGGPRDDDIDWTILELILIETHGPRLSTAKVAEAWLQHLPILQVHTAERAAYANLVRGIPASHAARQRNPYREFIGALIRGDIHGYLYPGDVQSAARSAWPDAALSHVSNGLYGQLWSAALVSAAFTARNAREALELSLTVVPQTSSLYRSIQFACTLRDECRTWQRACEQIHQAFSHLPWPHVLNNAALIASGLLWGEDDWTTSVCRTVMGGLDTDSNGATVGSVMGALVGTRGIPEHFTAPLDDRVRTAVFGSTSPLRISALAKRTCDASSRLRR